MVSVKLLLLGAAALSVTSASVLFPELSVGLEKRQGVAPGTPKYQCHSDCGNAILGSSTAGYCTNATWTGEYSNCLNCAGSCNFDIWRYYGSSLIAPAQACGLATTPNSNTCSGSSSAAAPASSSAAAPASSSAAAPASSSAAAATTQAAPASSSAAPGSSSAAAPGSSSAAGATSAVSSPAAPGSSSKAGSASGSATGAASATTGQATGAASPAANSGSAKATATSANGAGAGAGAGSAKASGTSTTPPAKFTGAANINGVTPGVVGVVVAAGVWAFAI